MNEQDYIMFEDYLLEALSETEKAAFEERLKADPKFKESAFAGEFGLDIAVQHSEDYWFEMCRSIEQILKSYGVQSNGLANGDYPLGKYVSFRNEAFVKNANGDSIYPPNNVGWNPRKHHIPINLEKFKTIGLEE